MSTLVYVNGSRALPLVALASWIAFSASVGCSDSAGVCVPGTQQACACPDGENGAQACNEEGSGFESCICPGDDEEPSAGAPTDGGAPPSNGGAPSDGGAPPSHGGAPPSDGGTSGDGGAGGSGDGPADCYDPSLEVDAPGDDALANLDRCTTTQINRFYSTCFGEDATEALCIGFHDDFFNAGCLDCLYAVDDDGNASGGTPPLLDFTDSNGAVYFLANQPACDAAAKGLPECGGPASDIFLCYYSSCADCATSADMAACTTFAAAPPSHCSTIPVPASCAPVLEDPIDPQCAGTSFEIVFKNAANLICGQ